MFVSLISAAAIACSPSVAVVNGPDCPHGRWAASLVRNFAQETPKRITIADERYRLMRAPTDGSVRALTYGHDAKRVYIGVPDHKGVARPLTYPHKGVARPLTPSPHKGVTRPLTPPSAGSQLP